MQIYRTLAASLLFALMSMTSQSQELKTTSFPKLSGEKWWGAMTALGGSTPFIEQGRTPSSSQSYNNQNVPLLVSNFGRYIASTVPFDFEITSDAVNIFATCDTIQVRVVGKNLRTGLFGAAQAFFKPSGVTPPDEFFSLPQYNTWIELNFNQNQRDILSYANGVLDSGLPAGILMIDDTWQRYFGSYDFKAERFDDPRGMVSQLHKKGFKVMLWVSPFVTGDSPEFRDLASKGYLIKEKNGEPAIIRWWNGYSALYDLTNPGAVDYLYGKLKECQQKYDIDGFKFDAGDLNFYTPQTQSYYDGDATAADHSVAWAQLALRFPYNELRACWGMQGEALVQRLGDKDYSWGALKSLIPEMINAGLMGYAYTCPDMIGGGQIGSFEDVQNQEFDQKLIVRSAQVHALMPMMQFSVAPWRVLSPENMAYVVEAARLHQEFAPLILKLARESAISGEPIVRSMEYNYPHKGFSDCQDQYMLGNEILVAPVMDPSGKRTVRLPSGRWLDDQGVKHKGPIVLEFTAPLSRLPYYKHL
ncbi:MAG: glycoside hydrolase family 31 protein [Rikenellaceae bacterium]